MADCFETYRALSRSFIEGRDFIVEVERRASPVALIAPHGGGLEPGTTEVASAVAGRVHSFYSFSALRPHGNRALHLTSHRFDEPRGLALVAEADYVVAVHGYRRDESTIYVGGLDERLRRSVVAALGDAGFEVSDRPARHLAGRHPENICNRGRRGAGVQLEICLGVRRRMFSDLSSRRGRQTTTPVFAALVAALAGALPG